MPDILLTRAGTAFVTVLLAATAAGAADSSVPGSRAVTLDAGYDHSHR